jgi:beta-glucosidase
VTQPLFDRGYGLSYAAARELGPVSEDPKTDLAAAVDINHLLVKGQAGGAWKLILADARGGTVVTAGSAASLGGILRMSPIDLAAQEDGRRFVWTGPASLSIEGPPADFSRPLNNAFALRLDVKVDAVPGAVMLSFGTRAFDIAPMLRKLAAGHLATLKIPLRCFVSTGAEAAAITTPLRIDAGPRTDMSLQSVTVEAVGEPLACP